MTDRERLIEIPKKEREENEVRQIASRNSGAVRGGRHLEVICRSV